MVGTFDTAVLTRVVNDPDLQPPSFLLDTFFPMIQTEDSEEIHFDVDESKPRISPFVHPLRAGRVVDSEGYRTDSFKPAYVKDKRRFDPTRAIKRTSGEMIGGNLSPAQRMDILLRRDMEDQLAMLARREEVMASEALRLGQVTVSGDDYPTKVIDFGRDAGLTINLGGGFRWGEAGIVPVDDLETWSGLVQTTAGVAAKTVVMDPKAWKLCRKDQDTKDLLETRRGSASQAELGPMARGPGNEKARFVGMIGDFEIWVYQDTYVDEAGATQQMLPDNTVIVGAAGEAGSGRNGLEGTRCYGMIWDEKANFAAERFFEKSWLEEDPAVRWLMLQSAPLVVPYRPNAVLTATVAV